ncbi:MAG: UbiX family flavin prenyltransferase [Candidatus Omnitrophica bacterium]|nr:UbiX family flavin prenyltransferase [Candidatus Omnitrophota bacterium]
MKRIIVGVTGASGAVLGERFVRHLLNGGHEAHVILSSSGVRVFGEELDAPLGDSFPEIERNFRKRYGNPKRLLVWPADDFAARISSGSAKMDAMVIIPCSLSTVGAIANGVTINLIHRTASVALKEKRPLILVPRESPLSPVHLKNLLYLAEIGVHVVPATTAFYHRPKTIEEMVDFTIGRVFDLLKIEHRLFKRWREVSSAE